MNSKLSKYLKKEYPDSKRDLFSVFIEVCGGFTKANRFYAMITQHSWMFLSSYEKLRIRLQNNTTINMLHLGTRAFEEIGGEVVQTTTFINKKSQINKYNGCYVRLVDFNNAKEKEIKTVKAIENPVCNYYYETNENNFEKIPGMPIAYWASDIMLKNFINSTKLGKISRPRIGQNTGNNAKYLRHWTEVLYNSITFDLKHNELEKRNYKWIPYNKGGSFRKWYGNQEFLINWKCNGKEIKAYAVIRNKGKHWSRYIQNTENMCKSGVTWTFISSTKFGTRYLPEGFICDVAGSAIFPDESVNNYLQGFLNTELVYELLKLQNPTLNFQAGNIASLPFKEEILDYKKIDNIVSKNISISKIDWDSFETSWNFKTHTLLDKLKQEQIPSTLQESYKNWKKNANNKFEVLKQNEEELNRIFIEIYGLEDELTPEVSDKDITITKIFDHKDEIYDDIKGNQYILTKEDVIKSFISYAVSCMFGRYSLDEEGLAYAGGEWDSSKYKSFKPVEDNVILITDEEYFEDDIVNRFAEFVKVAYGEETLEENLNFIADSLTGTGTSREKIRNYFLNKFYKDHVKTYKKTPIYWLYDSSAGKYKRDSHDGFKALIYMHRYDKDTIGKVRIDYLHKLQKEYEFRMENLQYDIDNNKNAREVAAAEKKFTKLTKQLKETKDYDEKIAHLALARIPIDFDDGVKVNYEKVQKDEDGNKLKILEKI